MTDVGIEKRSPLLDVRRLSVDFPTRDGLRRVVDDVSIQVGLGQTLGVVGESGSGKTTLGRAVLRLIEPAGGSILFDGADITRSSPREMRPLRARMQIVFQDSAGSLNPRMRVGDIISEPLAIHAAGDRAQREKRVAESLDRVRLPLASIQRYPHEFSGGQRQRINIARAIVLRPKFIICDEPVSALDVSIQAQILNLLRDLQRDLGLTYLFISHNLAVVRYMSDEVAVMHGGRIIEAGHADELFANPRNDYTRALLEAIPGELPPIA